MQWILEHQSVLVSGVAGAISSGVAVGWWVKQKMRFDNQLLEQQLELDQMKWKLQ